VRDALCDFLALVNFGDFIVEEFVAADADVEDFDTLKTPC
jgi:hypothetical protein